jgi:hypothetical protein
MNMVSNEKIYKIANAIKEIYGERRFDSPSSVVKFLENNVDQTSEYVRAFGPDAFVKISIALWGLYKGMSLQEIESIYDKLFFANIFYTNGDYHEEDCDSCDGNGSVECSQCDGSGNINCRTCDGERTTECEECGGEGEVDSGGDMVTCEKCDGDGEITCDSCGGDGDEECDECYGRGNEECENCEGNGTVTSDFQKDYIIEFIASWSEVLKNKCEIEEEQVAPVASLNKFDGASKHIVLSSVSDYGELMDDVRDGYVYCLQYFGDSPSLRFDGIRGTKIMSPGWDESHLLL